MKKYQSEQYLGADGVAGAATLAALNVPVEARIDQVRVNMERARWLLYKLQGTFVIVDIAGYKVALYRDGKAIWRSRVQVGKPYRSTPVFQSEITYVTFNPTWTVPPTILVQDMLPKIRSNPGYLAANRIRVLDREGNVLDPAGVDWDHPRGLTLRQDAGADNSLGQVVIRFPNDYAIYLHDTPTASCLPNPSVPPVPVAYGWKTRCNWWSFCLTIRFGGMPPGSRPNWQTAKPKTSSFP